MSRSNVGSAGVSSRSVWRRAASRAGLRNISRSSPVMSLALLEPENMGNATDLFLMLKRIVVYNAAKVIGVQYTVIQHESKWSMVLFNCANFGASCRKQSVPAHSSRVCTPA